MLNPSVQVTDVQGVFVAEFWDCLRLDPAPVADLRKEFDAHLAKGGRADLVIDLLGIGFAGSAALGGFVSLQRVARAKGGKMIFCNIDPTVFEVFRVSRLDSLFTFAADREASLRLVGVEPGVDPKDGETAVWVAPKVIPAPAPTTPAPRQVTGLSRLRRRREG
jgi:anti-anti-sigma factor